VIVNENRSRNKLIYVGMGHARRHLRLGIVASCTCLVLMFHKRQPKNPHARSSSLDLSRTCFFEVNGEDRTPSSQANGRDRPFRCDVTNIRFRLEHHISL